MRSSLRWLAIGVFLLSSSLNYLDRQLLPAVAPVLRGEFHLSNEDYGLLLTGFSIVYAVAAPFAGLFIDRVGLNTGIGVAVGCWSLAAMGTGLVSSFGTLFAARAALGAAQAAGIPGAGKANGTYLEPHELALGNGLTQVGIAFGSVAAPLLIGFFGAAYGWRSVFVGCGLLGFLWIPLWLWTAARVPKRAVAKGQLKMAVGEVLRDRRFWAVVIANILYMTMYTLWTNWTTLYFVEARGMSAVEANRQFAWIPPVAAPLGGLVGGAMAYRLIRAGLPVFEARMRVCLWSAVLLLATAAVPWMPSPFWAAAAISLSFFLVTAMSTNIYVMPIDFFGAGRAAFGVAGLTFSYGLMQAFVSPGIGRMIDRFGFASVCYALSPLPLAAVAVLRFFCHADSPRDAR